MECNGVFAHVNDSIRGLASDDPATQTWEFICECPELTCHALVSLTLSEFDERRGATPPLPILAAEHRRLGQAPAPAAIDSR
jgi:hypothetical protein